MGWSYPDISLEDLLKLIEGFLEMLILASGYQSSGRLAHWDSLNIKKSFQWALFLENVFKCLRCSDDYQGSVKEIDTALAEMTSKPFFPQGLRHLSSLTLSRARALMLKHLLQTLPLRDTHLRASVTAITEMGIDELNRIDSDCLHLHLERLAHDASRNPILTGPDCSPKDFTVASIDTGQSKKVESSLDGSFTMSAVQELGKRQLAVSCISAAETGLGVLSKIVGRRHFNEVVTTACGEQQQLVPTSMSKERPIEPGIWNNWQSRSLSYLLNMRTIRLASGAKLLFSAPTHQWIDVIEKKYCSVETDDDLSEKIELLLIGSMVHRWSSLIKTLMSSSYESLTISKLYNTVQNLPMGRFQNLLAKEDISSREDIVLEYLEGFLSNQFHWLWKLLPVLAAITIPPRSPLFRLYLIELESQIRGDSTNRYCSCIRDGKEHRECVVAERIWCLYIFHAFVVPEQQ